MNRLALSLAFITALAACGADAESREDVESQALGGDEPARTSTPGTVAPIRAAPPQPVRAIPAGTVLTFEVRESLSTSSSDAGDTFSLVLVDAVSGSAGAMLQAGASARGLVTDSRPSTGPADSSVLGLRVTSVEAAGSQRQIVGETQSATLDHSTRDSGTRSAATVATGAAAGAIIGQIIGRDTRSTVTGAAVGAAVGMGVALTTRGGHAELPVGSRIVVRLSQDLTF
jgi:hypothetical protein